MEAEKIPEDTPAPAADNEVLERSGKDGKGGAFGVGMLRRQPHAADDEDGQAAREWAACSFQLIGGDEGAVGQLLTALDDCVLASRAQLDEPSASRESAQRADTRKETSESGDRAGRARVHGRVLQLTQRR